MLIGLCPSLIFVPSFLHFNMLRIEVIPIEAMEPVEQLDSQLSQEIPAQEPPAHATAASSTHLLHVSPIPLQHMNLNF